MKKMRDYICIMYKNEIVEKDSKESFYVRSYLLYMIMSSEVKLLYKSDIDINVNSGNFKLNFEDKHQECKKKIFLSENDEFVINPFKVNIDPLKVKVKQFTIRKRKN